MNDYDDSSESEESSTDHCVEEDEEEDEDEYYYRRKRGYWDYNDFQCKKCKADDSYNFDVAVEPVILTNVPTLQEVATVSVAAALWNHVNIPKAVSDITDRCTKNTKKWKQLRIEVLSLVGELPVPNAVVERINKIIRKMAVEITYWVSYHYKRVFLARGSDNFVYSHVYNIVWYPNAHINYERTARNLMTSLRLSEVEKFKFLCTYCLKEEMEKLSPSLYSNTVLDYVTLANQPLIYYWYCYFRNELHKISGGSDDTPSLSLDVYMFQLRNVDNWSAKEYFFDRLSADEQVQQAIGLISSWGVFFQKAILMKLNETQRLSVYMERAMPIITNYTYPWISSKLILSTWFEARHLISESQFLTLFQLFIREGVGDTVLTDIWTSAPVELKHLVVNFNGYENVADVLLKWKWRDDSDFIFVLLQDLNICIKRDITSKDFFASYCEHLLRNGKLQRLDRWLEFCLPDPQEYLLFKLNYVKNSKQLKETCLNFYSSGDTNGLNDFLTQVMAAFPDFVIEYKKNLLMSSEGIEKCISVMDSETEILNVIIEDSLLDANLVTGFKKRMIFSPSAVSKLRNLFIERNLNSVKFCTDRYLSSSEDKKTLKKQLLGDFEKTLSAVLRKNDESYWQNLMIWFFGNEESVQQFKSTLKVDSMFIAMLKDCMFCTFDRFLTKCEFKNYMPSDFHFVDRFLNWYFQSSTKAKEFKLKMVNAYYRIDIFSTLMRGTRGHPQMRNMLKWFFQNDAEEMAKFKANTCGKFNNLI